MTLTAPARANTETLYESIKLDIVEGRLTGRVRFNELRDRYGSSVSSIREAVSRLIPEGLLEVERHRSLRVPALSSSDFLDLVAVRCVIEEQCLRDSIEHGNDDWRAQVLTALHLLQLSHRRPLPDASADEPGPAARTRRQQHSDLHNALVAACRSQRLLWLRQILLNQADRYLAVAFAVPLSADEHDLLERHAAMANAALEGRVNVAAALLIDDLNNAATLALPRIRQIEARQQEEER